MTCTACGDKQKNDRHFPGAVVEINNPERLIAFRKVVIPASLGDDTTVPASIGKYRNVILAYEANNHVYLYSSDGIPTLIAKDLEGIEELWEAIRAEEANRAMADAVLERGIVEEAVARSSADFALSSSIETLSSSLSAETTAREAADTTLQSNINTVAGDLATEVTNRTNADTALSDRVTAIEGVIPNQASSSNQLADKDFVNSSVATNTAYYISNNGQPFTSVAELEAYSGPLTNNDYAFVVSTDTQGNTVYDRYKYNADTEAWAFEYELNNSSFTANQWAAINSGITSGDVSKLNALADIQTIGANLTLANGELSATDTTYTAGSNVQISAQNVISATDTTYSAGTGLDLTGTTFSADTSVLATQNDLTTGLATKQNVLTAGNNITISNDTISATDTTYSNFTGTDGTTAGTAGLVPAPAATDADKYLKSDGTWDTVQAGATVVQTTGTSTTDVMSQNATTSMVFNDPGTTRQVRIGTSSFSNNTETTAVGYGASATGVRSTAIGQASSAQANYATAIGGSMVRTGSTNGLALGYASEVGSNSNYAIALGSYSKATQKGQMDISTLGTVNTYGYNNSQYRLLSGVYDGQSAHDAATYGQVISYSAINGAGAPTTATEGKYVGQLYYDTTNEAMYFLKAIDTTTTPATYTWEALGGGSSVNVVQTTGTSTTDVMSQNAVTSMVFADPANKKRVLIGGTQCGSDGSIVIGNGARGGASSNSDVVIGNYAYSYNGNSNIVVGVSAQTGSNASHSIAIGASAEVDEFTRGAIALGPGAHATTSGMVDIGASLMTDRGYNSTVYRLLTGLYDPQSAHDAATKGYVDTAVAGAGAPVYTNSEFNNLWENA